MSAITKTLKTTTTTQYAWDQEGLRGSGWETAPTLSGMTLRGIGPENVSLRQCIATLQDDGRVKAHLEGDFAIIRCAVERLGRAIDGQRQDVPVKPVVSPPGRMFTVDVRKGRRFSGWCEFGTPVHPLFTVHIPGFPSRASRHHYSTVASVIAEMFNISQGEIRMTWLSEIMADES